MQNQNLIFYYNCMIIYYIVLAFFIIMTIVFACLFIKAKMTYRRLLRKNLDENIAPIELVQKPEVVFSNIKDENEQQILKRLQLLFEEEHIYLNPAVDYEITKESSNKYRLEIKGDLEDNTLFNVEYIDKRLGIKKLVVFLEELQNQMKESL